jgi:hypothetical protein
MENPTPIALVTGGSRGSAGTWPNRSPGGTDVIVTYESRNSDADEVVVNNAGMGIHAPIATRREAQFGELRNVHFRASSS